MGSTRNLSVQKSQFSILKETQNFDKQSITSKKKVDEKKEAAEILKTTADNIKTLDNEDASLSDIKSLMN